MLSFGKCENSLLHIHLYYMLYALDCIMKSYKGLE
jgi:hypothetical protein